MYYKLGQLCFITNWSKCCCKLGQLLQITATVITKKGSYYQLGQKGLLRNRLNEVGEKTCLENMLNLGSKTSLSSQNFTMPSNFRNHAETLRQGHFLDLHGIVFVINDLITISVSIILSINR